MNQYAVGQRVSLHAATSEWMQGDRYGEVVGHGRAREFVDTFTGQHIMARPVKVKLDRSGRVRRFHPDNLFPNRWDAALVSGVIVERGK